MKDNSSQESIHKAKGSGQSKGCGRSLAGCIGLLGSVITIFVFLTGIPSIVDLASFSSPTASEETLINTPEIAPSLTPIPTVVKTRDLANDILGVWVYSTTELDSTAELGFSMTYKYTFKSDGTYENKPCVVTPHMRKLS